MSRRNESKETQLSTNRLLSGCASENSPWGSLITTAPHLASVLTHRTSIFRESGGEIHAGNEGGGVITKRLTSKQNPQPPHAHT